MLLAIDGMNGAGKTSVIQPLTSQKVPLVSETIISTYVKHFPLSFTSPLTSDTDITVPAALYNYGSIMQKLSYTEAIYDIAAINPTIFDSTLFVFDRWVPSGIVYPMIDASLSGSLTPTNEFYAKQVKLHDNVLEPDLTILLIADPVVCHTRIENRARIEPKEIVYPSKYTSISNLEKAYFWFSHIVTDIPRSILIDTTSIDVFTLKDTVYDAIKYSNKDEFGWSVLEYLLASDIHPFVRVANVS